MFNKISTPAKVTGGIMIALLFVFLWVTGNYNSLISSKNSVDKSWARVETQYQRRLDLIDNLVSSTKGAQGQERAVFIAIAEARTKYNNATSSNDKASAASQIETNVALLPRLQEAYPDLKSNQQVQSIQLILPLIPIKPTAHSKGIASLFCNSSNSPSSQS